MPENKSEVEKLREENAALKAANEKLKAENADAEKRFAKLSAERRLDEVKAFLELKGVAFSDDAAKPYLAMSDEVWAAVRAEGEQFARAAEQDDAERHVNRLPPEFYSSDQGGNGGSRRLSDNDNPLLRDARRRAGV